MAEPRQWLVAGVGRSGTTAIYEGLQNCTHQSQERFRFFYEPYLWGPPTWTDPFRDAAGAFASTSAIDSRGLRTHLATPLFIPPGAPRHPAHEVFINRVFPKATNSLAKIIRGCGRLRDYLSIKPALKIVYIIRNPLDCVNSALEHFTYYGDEFHPSDMPRFAQELNIASRQLRASESAAAVLWWSEMNKAALSALEEFPGRSIVMPYEAFSVDREASFLNIISFLGIAADVKNINLGRPAGPVSSERMLRAEDVSMLISYHEWYFSNVDQISGLNNLSSIGGLGEEIRKKYDGTQPGVFKSSIPRDLSPTRIRDMLARQMNVSKAPRRGDQRAPNEQVAQPASELAEVDHSPAASVSNAKSQPIPEGAPGDTPTPTGSSRAVIAALFENPVSARLATESALALRAAADAYRVEVANMQVAIGAKVDWIRNEPAIACVITSFNNGPALRRAVESVLAQALPPKEVLIADDCSSAESRDIAVSLQDKGRNIKVLLRERNLGPGLNRDLAVRGLSSPFITTLDGDDEFGPLKLSAEWAALGERIDGVSFSDLVIIKPPQTGQIISTQHFGELSNNTTRVDAVINRTQWLPHNMLYSRDLYVRSGGYDCGAYMYEDWSLKIRLSIEAKSWFHSAVIGLIYNRHGHGLSSSDKKSHCYWQLHVIHSNLDLIRATLSAARIIDAITSVIKAHGDEPWRTEAMAAVEDAVAAIGPKATIERFRAMKVNDGGRLANSHTLKEWPTDWIKHVRGGAAPGLADD